ncbi:MAG: Rieske 2Fe-2S domain-containing protein [Actinobacteria bacterium]|nr:MAG: Rieske 2Fe-2S domain-containing protein [Actinomycetota bacterium]
MSAGTVVAIAVPVVVLMLVTVGLTTAARRDRRTAVGELTRETRRRDRDAPDEAEPAMAARLTGREVERAAVLEREHERAVVLAPPPAPPARRVPLDPETLGVTRRQFLNRGIVQLFGIGLGAFGAATIAFLWPSATGGFGSKIVLPDSLDDILSQIRDKREPYYYAPGRVYVNPYPKDALGKAKKVYMGGVLDGMDAGVVALYQKCVHLGCRVPWCKVSQWFECPCHGSKYNRVGEKKGGPAPRGLDRFPVKIEGGKVNVDTGTIILGPPIGTNTTGQEAEGPHCVSIGNG